MISEEPHTVFQHGCARSRSHLQHARAGSLSSTFSPALAVCRLGDGGHSDRRGVTARRGFNCVPLTVGDVELIFTLSLGHLCVLLGEVYRPRRLQLVGFESVVEEPGWGRGALTHLGRAGMFKHPHDVVPFPAPLCLLFSPFFVLERASSQSLCPKQSGWNRVCGGIENRL